MAASRDTSFCYRLGGRAAAPFRSRGSRRPAAATSQPAPISGFQAAGSRDGGWPRCRRRPPARPSDRQRCSRREGDPVRNRRPFALVSLVVGLALLAGACGNQTSGTGTAAAGGTPQQGGTLKLVGSSDVDHLDTASAYYVASYTLER